MVDLMPLLPLGVASALSIATAAGAGITIQLDQDGYSFSQEVYFNTTYAQVCEVDEVDLKGAHALIGFNPGPCE